LLIQPGALLSCTVDLDWNVYFYNNYFILFFILLYTCNKRDLFYQYVTLNIGASVMKERAKQTKIAIAIFSNKKKAVISE